MSKPSEEWKKMFARKNGVCIFCHSHYWTGDLTLFDPTTLGSMCEHCINIHESIKILPRKQREDLRHDLERIFALNSRPMNKREYREYSYIKKKISRFSFIETVGLLIKNLKDCYKESASNLTLTPELEGTTKHAKVI
jgi:hypothetical protein